MKLESVNSSNVAAIGHLCAQEVLLVLYRDGAMYARPEFTAADMAALRAAPSVGQFLAANKTPAVLIRKGGDARRGPNPEQPAALNPAAGPMETFQEDECCGRLISRAMLDGKLVGRSGWGCEKCGQEWRAHMVAGVKHWAPFCPVAVF